jgi:hypothetical protein
MDFIIDNWKVILPIGVFFLLLMWGLVALANADWKRREKADEICKEFEDRIDETNTVDGLLEIQEELIAGHTTPNPFKDDSVFIQLNNPERVRGIMLLIQKKIKWARYHEVNKR